MSYRCEICLEPQPMGTAPTRVVTRRRQRPHHPGDKPAMEIAQEKDCCPPCVEVANARREQQEAELATIAKEARELPPFGNRPGEWR